MAWKHLTVSKAMKKDLIQLTGVDPNLIHVVYDRATSKFKTLSQDEKSALFENKYPEERFYNRTVVIDIVK